MMIISSYIVIVNCLFLFLEEKKRDRILFSEKNRYLISLHAEQEKQFCRSKRVKNKDIYLIY